MDSVGEIAEEVVKDEVVDMDDEVVDLKNINFK